MNFAKLKRKAAFSSYSLGGLTCAGKTAGKLKAEDQKNICKRKPKTSLEILRRSPTASDDKRIEGVLRKFNLPAPSESPRELGVATALDQGGCGSSGRLDELKVLIPYEILPDQAD
jgi:hypothetical protein